MMLTRTHPSRLRILTWHVHGNYLYYVSQVPHDFYLVTRPGHPPGYAGRVGALPWGDNVHEVPYDMVPRTAFDCVLYQSRHHYEHDRVELLSPAQRALPSIYLEHDPPQQHPTDTRHWVRTSDTLLVHVTPFNALMWDSGTTPTAVIEHGVQLPCPARYCGDLPKGVTAVNNLYRRGRRLGPDVFDYVRERVPLDLFGMGNAEHGLGEVPNPELASRCAHYRFFFNPIRYTSLGLAVIEAMMIGMPVVGLATTELATVIRSGVNGYVDTRPELLVRTMRQLLNDRRLAAEWGDAARRTARQRFGIERFCNDWLDAFASVTT
jgi:glycosyltransferase involved in cell wall biosynthesis